MSSLARVVDLGGDTGHVLELRAGDLEELRDGIRILRRGACADVDKARAVHMYLVFNQHVHRSLTQHDAINDQREIAWEFGEVVHDSLPGITTFRLRMGSDRTEPDVDNIPPVSDYTGPEALEIGRYLMFLVQLIDAAQHWLCNQLQEFDTPTCFYNLQGFSHNKWTTLKTIRILDSDHVRRKGPFWGGIIFPVFTKLNWPKTLTSVIATGTSAGHGFKEKDIRDVRSIDDQIHEGGAGLTGIAFQGHHDFTLRELSWHISEWMNYTKPIGLCRLTVPLPQYTSVQTLRSHQAGEKIVWTATTMLVAATIIYAEHALCRLHLLPKKPIGSTLHSIYFSNEGFGETRVKIDKDSKGVVTFSVEDGNLPDRKEKHGPLSKERLEWMCSDGAWRGLESRMLYRPGHDDTEDDDPFFW